jgi:uncharacterized protein (TIGR03067 family)
MKIQATVFALAAGLLLAADKPNKDDGNKKAKGLEGTWVVVSLTANGKPNDDAKDTKVVFEGKNITVKTKNGDRKSTFKIDPKKKTIDIVRKEKDGEKTSKGIYQLKGDELKICFARPDKDRPKDFTAAEDSGHTLVVLKRAKSE